MPICTTCTHPVPFLYTVYESAHNLRLEQCTACNNFADPYVEHDSLTLLLDLILLKRGVYRHLLYNRGTEPRRAGATKENLTDLEEKQREREKSRWMLILRLGSVLVLVDAFIRWTHFNHSHPIDITPSKSETITAFVRTFIGCLVETVAFHAGIMLSCYLTLNILDWVISWKRIPPAPISGIRQEFRFTLIPLTLLYSSMSKLFLLFLLSVWRPAIPEQPTTWNTTSNDNPFISSVLEILDDDKLDREWVVRNVLGGMSAGFGLRVIFDWHPIFTTIIILAGWAVKTLVSGLLSGWVGGDEKTGEAWLEYSIP